MSMSLLYHGFGIRGYHYKWFTLKKVKSFSPLKKILHHFVVPVAMVVMLIAAVKFFAASKPCQLAGSRFTLLCISPRVECHLCGIIRKIEIGFTDPRHTYTKSFEHYALEILRHMTIQDAAKHLGVS